MKPSIRAKKLEEISEDLEEVKKEIFHLERSREKARNLNADEGALWLTKEMDPLRVRKRRLEEELLLLRNKEKKSSKDKERRQRKGRTLPPGETPLKEPTSCEKGSLDLFLKQIEGKGQSSSNSAGQVQGDDDASDHQQGDEESSSQSSGNSYKDKCKEVKPLVIIGVKRKAVKAVVTQQDRCKKVTPLLVLRVKGRVGHHHHLKQMILF